MDLPITLKLKRNIHKQIAYAQDLAIDEIYKSFPKAILHGGTTIWRCYNGNRFSEDIDIYIKKDTKRIEELFSNLKKIGFKVLKKRIKENSLYSLLEFNRVELRIEAIFKTTKFILKEYEKSDGLMINIYTLDPENLVKEKVQTYLKRRLIRDLYDIFFLLRHIKQKGKVKTLLLKLIENFKSPIDEELLKILIISGIVPTSKEMFNYIKKWVK